MASSQHTQQHRNTAQQKRKGVVIHTNQNGNTRRQRQSAKHINLTIKQIQNYNQKSQKKFCQKHKKP